MYPAELWLKLTVSSFATDILSFSLELVKSAKFWILMAGGPGHCQSISKAFGMATPGVPVGISMRANQSIGSLPSRLVLLAKAQMTGMLMLVKVSKAGYQVNFGDLQ